MLRLFYACYFTAVAVSLPFFPSYLRGLGLNGREIATMLAIGPLMHLGAPLAWGWLSDRTRRPDLVLRLVCFGAFFFVLPLLFVRTMPQMLPVYAAHQLFGVAIVGLTDALALERVRAGDDYGRIRVWGSLSFAVTCLIAGHLLAARGPRPGDILVPALLAAALGVAALASLGVRGHGGDRERPHLRDVVVLLRDRRFLFLLAVAPLHWAFAAPYHGFFAILLQDRGLPPTVVGHAFTVSVVAEMGALYYFRGLRARLGLGALLSLALGATALRWGLIAVVHAPLALVAIQALHALTFGVFWAASLAWVGECVSPSLRATGQTLFTGTTFGLGNILGMLASGALYDGIGAAPAFALAGGLELIPLLLVLLWGRRLDPSVSSPSARTRS